jgi:hypothetical protein
MAFEIRGPLTSRIGKMVRYGAPGDVRKTGSGDGAGIIVDEVWVDENLNSSPPRKGKGVQDWGDYSFCAQRIKWESDSPEGDYSIRLAYYRRPPGENFWRFAAQTTVSSHSADIKRLLESVLKKKDWFEEKA